VSVADKESTKPSEGNGASTAVDKALSDSVDQKFARAAKKMGSLENISLDNANEQANIENIEEKTAKEKLKAAKDNAAAVSAPSGAPTPVPEKKSMLKWLGAGIMGGAAKVGRAKHIAINLGQKNVASDQATFLYFGLFVHLLDAFSGFANIGFRALMYPALWFAGWYLGFKPRDIPLVSRDGLRIGLFSLIFAAIAFFWPTIVSLLFALVPGGEPVRRAMNIVMVFFPPIIIYFFLVHPLPREFLKPWVTLAWYIEKVIYTVWIVLGILYFSTFLIEKAELIAPQVEGVEVVGAFADVWGMGKEVVVRFFETAAAAAGKGMAQAFGWGVSRVDVAAGREGYRGEIDTSAERKFGIKLGIIKPIGPVTTASEINLQTEMMGDTERDKPIMVAFSCKAEKGKNTYPASRVIPSGLTEITGKTERLVKCTFDPEEIPKGSVKFFITGVYGFRSTTEYAGYFVSSRVDEKEFYKNRKKLSPKTSYGPINVKIVFSPEPKVISDISEVHILSLLIKKSEAWPGMVKRLKKVVLITPKGLVVQKVSGAALPRETETYTQVTCGAAGETKWCKDEKMNVFTFVLGDEEEIKKEKEFSLELTVDDRATLFGDAATVPYSIFITTEYDFAYEKTKTLSVKEVET